MIFAHTDTSVKNGISTHSYILRTYKGRKIKEISYVSHETNTVLAEMDSLIRLLNYCSSKDIKDVKIFTDSKRIFDAVKGKSKVKFDISYLQHMLNITGSKLRWKPRHKNREAHESCAKLMKVVENRINSKSKKVC